ncbi:MAG: hypothetical protein LBL95_00290, partial [Deltaproteobacteria bacterium]|nr:hypothetical protein [Deltaproteobacteria bacterium]
PSDICGLGQDLPRLERELLAIAGLDLVTLAARALDARDPMWAIRGLLSSPLAVAVIPDTSGEGIIPGFAEALAAIVAHMGGQATIGPPDAQGRLEAKKLGVDLILTSSDDDFLCQNLGTRAIAKNGPATGQGFAQVLFHMARGQLRDREVLVLGAGPVGRSAASHLSFLGARPVIHDLDPEKAAQAAGAVDNARPWAPGLGTIPSDFPLILEASSSAWIWPEESVAPGTLIAAPGMPFSFRPSTRYVLWAEPLATGTAVMVLGAALGLGGARRFPGLYPRRAPRR